MSWDAPSIAPAVLAFVGCIVAGATSFGQASVFIVGWSILGVIYGVDQFKVSKGVLYTNLVNLASCPTLVYAARKELRHILFYGVLVGAVSAAVQPLGVFFLLNADPSVIRLFVGAVFFVFAVVQLFVSALEFGRKRLDSMRESAAATDFSTQVEGAIVMSDVTLGGSGRGSVLLPTVMDPTWFQGGRGRCETTVTRPTEGGANGPRHWACMDACFDRFPQLEGRMASYCPPISESGVAIETTLLVLAVSAAAAGFLSSTMGTSTPPQVAAFAYLDLTRGSIKGIKVFTTLWASVTRIILFAVDGEQSFKLAEWPVYASVCVASLLGSLVGSWLRRYTNKERLLYLIFWLLWVTSAMLFGLLENAAFGIREIVLLGILALIIAVQWVCYFHTLFVQGIVDAVRKCCACKSDVCVADTSAAQWTTQELGAAPTSATSPPPGKLATIVEMAE